jgi:hypothetical protein
MTACLALSIFSCKTSKMLLIDYLTLLNVRYCIDYWKLNKVTIKDVYPLPLVDDCIDTFAGSVWFSKLDANSAFFQLNIRESFGLCGALPHLLEQWT